MASVGFTKEDTLKVKGIAIILLLFHHLFRTVERLQAYDIRLPEFITPEFVASAATDSRLCVWIFTFLSAYGLSFKLMRKQDVKNRYIYKQYISLMSPFWFIYIVIFAASFFLFKSPIDVYNGNLLYAIPDFLGISDLLGLPMLSSVWWYMCFAQFLLLGMPILVALVEKAGSIGIILLYIFLNFWGGGYTSSYGGSYTQYMYAALMAVLCAKNDLFTRMSKRHGFIIDTLEAILLLAGCAGLAHLKTLVGATEFRSFATILSGISVVCLCLFVQKYCNASIIRKPLIFLGKHSGNMFMIHAMIFVYHSRIVYWSHSVIVSTATLLAISLLISMLIEFVKKIIRYNQAVSAIFEKLHNLIAKSDSSAV